MEKGPYSDGEQYLTKDKEYEAVLRNGIFQPSPIVWITDDTGMTNTFFIKDKSFKETFTIIKE